MSRFHAGDKVVSAKDIGGIMRDHVPKGSRGVVTEAEWLGSTKVLFTVDGGFLGSDRKVEITVDEDEIA
jgi:hypothetical protein